MSRRTVVIVNPHSRSGETGKRLVELEALLREYVPDHELAITRGPGDATRIAREAVLGGATRIVIAGGDGTTSEALNGIVGDEDHHGVELGLLPLGSGRDFARLLKLGTDLEAAVKRIERGYRRAVDVGRVQFVDKEGNARTRVFLNIASFGVTGDAALWLDELGRQGRRGRFSYVIAGVVGHRRWRAPRMRIRVDGREVFAGRLDLAAIANGQYFAGGMHVAPNADVSDGLFDVVAVPHMRFGRALSELPRVMRGTHVTSRGVVVERGRVVEVEAEAEAEGSVWIEADGEPIGTLPARFEILHGAITLCGMP